MPRRGAGPAGPTSVWVAPDRLRRWRNAPASVGAFFSGIHDGNIGCARDESLRRHVSPVSEHRCTRGDPGQNVLEGHSDGYRREARGQPRNPGVARGSRVPRLRHRVRRHGGEDHHRRLGGGEGRRHRGARGVRGLRPRRRRGSGLRRDPRRHRRHRPDAGRQGGRGRDPGGGRRDDRRGVSEVNVDVNDIHIPGDDGDDSTPARVS